VLFTEPSFLFLFLPLLLGAYLLAPIGVRNGILAFASLVFYSWDEFAFTLVLLASIAGNYLFGLALGSVAQIGRRKIVLTVAVLGNLGILGFYKYSGFLVGALNPLLERIGVPLLSDPHVELPLGISFFTFQAMSYLVDVYRRVCPAQRNALDLTLYIAFFPQLIAGPIVRYKEIAAQIQNRVVTNRLFADGVRRFVYGLGKKVLVANTIAGCVDGILELPSAEITCSLAWGAMIGYTLQIYFDFSGYSDMAIGLGKMFGFKIPENFNHPYISRSITEFWRRWHMTLSAWFRDYVYIPLGGNRVRAGRTYLNLAAVFLLCGLWHGAAWNFLVWGLFHGTLLAVERAWLGDLLRKAPRILAHLYTLTFLLIGWVWFRAETLPAALNLLKVMFGFQDGGGTHLLLRDYLAGDSLIALALGVVLAAPLYPVLRSALAAWVRRLSDRPARWSRLQLVRHCESLLIFSILVLALVWISAFTYSPFIYFRF
jgi:alginate O-acetyltransferase complex protein AlgI